ncbi:MAG: HAD-IIIC family phosphatase, partial [Salinibacterium sp.]|nr:HAD-IIIC family phosphatase [Salinibacterium sp.]
MTPDPELDAASEWSDLLSAAAEEPSFVALGLLARRARRLVRSVGGPPAARPLRLAILSGESTELLVGPLELLLRVRGIEATIQGAAPGNWVAELLDPGSSLSQARPDQIVLVPTEDDLPPIEASHLVGPAANEQATTQARAFWRPLEDFHGRCGTEFVVTNLIWTRPRPMGSLGATCTDDPLSRVRRFNLALADTRPDFVNLFDLEALAARVGYEIFRDPRFWNTAKQICAPAAVPALARGLAAVLAATQGLSKKVCVVDLDDTLWGGVIGDDGVEGIKLHEGDAVGEAFRHFQRYLKGLADRGVLLAVCSKNDADVAKRPFEKHPGCILELDDFVGFQANWQPKSDNLWALARQLNLGLDSFVFVDDNPAEREEVRQALPQVRVPELPDDPSGFADCLASSGYFEVVRLTDDDTRRAARPEIKLERTGVLRRVRGAHAPRRLDRSDQVTRLDDGRLLWSLDLTSPGAVAVRARLRRCELPAGA